MIITKKNQNPCNSKIKNKTTLSQEIAIKAKDTNPSKKYSTPAPNPSNKIKIPSNPKIQSPHPSSTINNKGQVSNPHPISDCPNLYNHKNQNQSYLSPTIKEHQQECYQTKMSHQINSTLAEATKMQSVLNPLYQDPNQP